MGTIEKAMERRGQEPRPRSETPKAEEAPVPVLAPLSSPSHDEPPARENREAVVQQAENPSKQRRTVAIDFERLAANGLLSPNSANDSIASEFRAIKRPLLRNAFGKGITPLDNGNLIMITSAQPGEGKTFVSVNLAMSIAMERDTTVLLVDADVIKPMISKTLGIPSAPGLVDCLLSGRDVSEFLLKTNVPKFTILPAGSHHAHSTELLNSDAMSALARELASRYSDRIILFDSSPLLATNEAAVVAGMMGQVVMVVEAERTPQALVKESLAMLDSSLHVSFVLNKSTNARRSKYYGYYGYHEK